MKSWRCLIGMPRNIGNRLPVEPMSYLMSYFSHFRQEPILLLFWGIGCVIAALMLFFGTAFPQVPFSDFETHWNQSQNLDAYIKGGGSALIYKLVSVFAQHAWLSALVVNLISWITFLYVLIPQNWQNVSKSRGDRIFISLFAISLFFFGFWWVATASTVAILPLHLALFALALKLAIVHGAKSIAYSGAAIILLAFALSMRMQTVLAIILGMSLFGCFFLVQAFFLKKSWSMNFRNSSKRFYLVLVASILLGIFAEIGLRMQSDNIAEIERSQRAQLYNGIFMPFSRPSHCGGWSQSNWDLAMKERGMSSIELAKKYLPMRSADYYAKAVSCKYSRLVSTNFYIWWVPRAVGEQQGTVIENYDLLAYYIGFQNLILKLCLLIMVSVILVKFGRFSSAGTMFLSSVILGMLIVVGLLEFNSRYSFLLLGYFLLYCSLKYQLRLDRPEP
jgi:hypothetical protein